MFGWFSKRKPDPTAAWPERYHGKPLLVILENYVLDCIGCLSAEKQAQIQSVVQRAWGGDANWQETVRQRCDLEPQTDSEIRRLWAKNQEIARSASQTLTPDDFARMFVDANWAKDLG